MLKIITNDNDLRVYLPNAFATADGEPSFFDKLYPWLQAAEDWLADKFVSHDLMQRLADISDVNPLKTAAASVVATEAIFRAVPALDLVLTPNGFGIVSNDTVAPASKERVERLLESLDNDRAFYIDRLIKMLFDCPEWQSSNTKAWFCQSLFYNLDIARACDYKSHLYQQFLGLRSRSIELENLIANRYVSPEQMEVFRNEAFLAIEHPEMVAPLHVKVIKTIRAMIVCKLTGGKITYELVSDMLELMRKNPDTFQEFNDSDTKLLLEPPIFQNEKKASGYWF